MEVDRVVRKSFAHTQVAQVHPAKYNKATKLAYVSVAEEDMDIIMAAQQADSFIDIYAHLSPEEVDIKKTQQAALLRATSESDPAAYDFDNGQDVTSIHAGVQHPQMGSGASIGASKYSVVTDANGLQLDSEIEDKIPHLTGVTFAMEREDGTLDEVIRLPETLAGNGNGNEEKDEDSKDGSDIDMQEALSAGYDDDEDEDEIEQTLIYMICSAPPDDIHTMDTMLDQLKAEQFDTVGTAETAPGMRDKITDEMRAALTYEAQDNKMSTLAYIHDLRCSLYRSYGKGGADSDEEAGFFSDTEEDESEDPSFRLLLDKDLDSPETPALVETSGQGTDPTGLFQGSDSTTHGSNELNSANTLTTGHEAAAYLGGVPG